MRFFPIVCLASLLACASCNTARIDNPVAFDANEAAFIKTQGKATIDGHAFVVNYNGYVVHAAGQQVWLVPVTAYSTQRIQAIFRGRQSIRARNISRVESDPDYIKYTRVTKADSGGKFSFDNVAPGDYYVVSQMTWRKDDSILTEGAEMYETVKITGKEKGSVDVIVSGSISGS